MCSAWHPWPLFVIFAPHMSFEWLASTCIVNILIRIHFSRTLESHSRGFALSAGGRSPCRATHAPRRGVRAFPAVQTTDAGSAGSVVSVVSGGSMMGTATGEESSPLNATIAASAAVESNRAKSGPYKPSPTGIEPRPRATAAPSSA